MAESATVRFPVDAVQIMLFARSIGENNPAFVDITLAKEMVAPPTFTETLQHFIPDYEFRPNPVRPWIGSGRLPTGLVPATVGGGALHAEQHFEYHAPIRPGDVLTATIRPGRTWQKHGRNGAMRFFERITEFRNEKGDLVVTSTLVGVTMESSTDAGASGA